MHVLAKNGDDHVATIPDFYLEQQAFGTGSHPQDEDERVAFQDVEARYTIQLSVTS